MKKSNPENTKQKPGMKALELKVLFMMDQLEEKFFFGPSLFYFSFLTCTLPQDYKSEVIRFLRFFLDIHLGNQVMFAFLNAFEL